MKKFTTIAVVLGLAFAVFAAGVDSSPLQDGYRLQGWLGTGGEICHGYFKLVVRGDVMGVQGSKKGIVFGWVGAEPIRYFVLHTQTGLVEWGDGIEHARRLERQGSPVAEMNKEVNLSSLRSGFGHFSSE